MTAGQLLLALKWRTEAAKIRWQRLKDSGADPGKVTEAYRGFEEYVMAYDLCARVVIEECRGQA